MEVKVENDETKRCARVTQRAATVSGFSSEGEETVYEMVEDDAELEALGKVFVELMEDVDLEF